MDNNSALNIHQENGDVSLVELKRGGFDQNSDSAHHLSTNQHYWRYLHTLRGATGIAQDASLRGVSASPVASPSVTDNNRNIKQTESILDMFALDHTIVCPSNNCQEEIAMTSGRSTSNSTVNSFSLPSHCFNDTAALADANSRTSPCESPSSEASATRNAFSPENASILMQKIIEQYLNQSARNVTEKQERKIVNSNKSKAGQSGKSAKRPGGNLRNKSNDVSPQMKNPTGSDEEEAPQLQTCTEKIRYKTEFCRNVVEKGYCQFGDFCHFAHSDDELRPRSLDSKYKTSNCRSYHGSSGICYYAKRCDYIHGESPEELMRIRRYNQLYNRFKHMFNKNSNPPSFQQLEEIAAKTVTASVEQKN